MVHRSPEGHYNAIRRVCAIAALLALSAGLTQSGCASGDSPLAQVDPNAVPDTTTYDQVFVIIQRDCLPCHDNGGVDPPYDTCENVVANYSALFNQVIETNQMPPGAWPRLSSEERLILIRWNGEAPCTQ
jgi:uncharacterized membrane protein